MAKLASKHRTSNICLPTGKNVFDLNQNVLAEHEMFEKIGGGETSKQGQSVELSHVRQTMLVSFSRPLLQADLQ